MNREIALIIIFFFFSVSIVAQQQPKLMLPIGHTDAVTSATFSPDGKKIVTASKDATAHIWDVETGKLLGILKGHSGLVTSAKFSRDGKKIVTLSLALDDLTARIWDSETGKLLVVIGGKSYKVISADLSPNGKSLVTASIDGEVVRIWDAEKGTLIAKLGDKSDKGVNSVKFSPDGKKIVTTGNNKILSIIWDAETRKQLATFSIGSSAVFSPDGKKIVTDYLNSGRCQVWDAETGMKWAELRSYSNGFNSTIFSFSPDGNDIVIASDDKTARIWDAINGNLLATLAGHSGSLNSAAYSPDGNKIITASSDKTARIWDAKNGNLLATLAGHSGGLNFATFSPDGKKIITASNDNSARIWDGETGKLLATLVGHSSGVYTASFSPDGEKFVIGSNGNNTSRIWDAKTGKLLVTLKDFSNDFFRSTMFSPDGKNIATFNEDTTARIWDVETGKILTIIGHSNFVRSAMYSPDGKKIVTTSKDKTVRIWDSETGKPLIILEGHLLPVQSAMFSSDSKYIVTTSEDKTARIWDSETGKLLTILEGHSNYIRSVVFSPDGKKIVTTSEDNTARIWDTKSGAQLVTLKLYLRDVNYADFSPDGKMILTFSDYPNYDNFNNPELWDAWEGKLLFVLKGHSKPVISAAFSPDGMKIVSSSLDNTAMIWNAKTGKVVASLEAHSNDVNSATFSPDGKNILTASEDNTTRIWDAEKGKLLYTILAIDETDYLIYDEHYRFDGTEAARKLLYFTCGLEVIELDQVKDQLWVPNLAERIMKGEEINAPKLSDLDLCDLIPKVEDQEGPRGEYHYKIIPRRGGLGQTILYVNGIEVKRLEPKDLLKQGTDYFLKLRQTDLDPYFIAGQENKVSVRAFTAKNDIGSRGAIAMVTSDKKVDPPSLHAVLVGVSDYKGEALDLKFAAKDARDFGNVLKASASKLFNYDGVNRINLYSIHTESDRSYFPDKNSLKKVFETIGKQAKPNDVLLIFFAGHGVMNPIDQQFYFLTADASAMTNPEASGLSTRELFDWIQPANIKAMKRVLILDACNSGQAIKDIVKLGDQPQQYLAARNDDQGKFIKAIDKLNERSGLFILSASASDQSAYEMGRYNQGVLTYSLLKSIKEDPTIVDNQSFLDVSKWFDASEKIVEEITKMTGARQQPQIVRTTNFNIGLVDDEVRSRIVLPTEKPLFSYSNFQNSDEEIAADNLGLNKIFDQELNRISSRSVESSLSYFPTTTNPEAWQLTGRYTVKDNKIIVRIFLRQKNEIVHRLEVAGEMDKLSFLAQDILTKALNLIK